MSAKSVGFSLADEEERELDELVSYFSPGNRSAFLRMAMKQMRRLRRAEELRELQTYGRARRIASGLGDVPISDVVHRALAAERR